MVDVVPLSEEHFIGFTPKAVFEDINSIQNLREAHAAGAPMFALLLDDKVIGIVGALFYFKHAAEAFGVYSDDIKKCKLSFHKAVKKTLDEFFVSRKLQRLQMVVRADYLEGQRWAEGLGFSAEGFMHKYGPTGLDYFMYGKVE
jgi:hypothetical protein